MTYIQAKIMAREAFPGIEGADLIQATNGIYQAHLMADTVGGWLESLTFRGETGQYPGAIAEMAKAVVKYCELKGWE